MRARSRLVAVALLALLGLAACGNAGGGPRGPYVGGGGGVNLGR